MEKLTPQSFPCGHCGNVAPQEIVINHAESEERDDVGFQYQVGTTWEITKCSSCRKVSLIQILWHSEFEPWNWEYKVLYPPTLQPILGLPQSVQTEYSAALKLKKVDENAFATSLRRVLEAMCLDKGATGHHLEDKLKDLSSKEVIPIHLVGMAHQLRKLGNVGAHADLGTLSENEAPFLHDVCRAILEYVYSTPLLVEKAKELLEKLKGAS